MNSAPANPNEGEITFLAMARCPLACLIIDDEVIGLHEFSLEDSYQDGAYNLLYNFFQEFKDTKIMPDQLSVVLNEAKPVSTDKSIVGMASSGSIIAGKKVMGADWNHGMHWEMSIDKKEELPVNFSKFQIEFGEPLEQSISMKPKEAFLVIGNILVAQYYYLCEKIYLDKNPNCNKKGVLNELKQFHETSHIYYRDTREYAIPYDFFLVEYTEYIRQQLTKRYLTPFQILKTGGVYLLVLNRDLEVVQKFLFDVYFIMKNKDSRMRLSQSLKTAYYTLMDLLYYEVESKLQLNKIRDKIFLRNDFRIEMSSLSKTRGMWLFKEVKKKFPPDADRWYRYELEF